MNQGFDDIPPEELNWTKAPIIGMLLTGAEIDSHGNAIEPNRYYYVAKHIPTGKIVIAPTDRNQKTEFTNEIMKKSNRLN